MAEERSHKTTANRIAKKLGTAYNGSGGVDIKSQKATVEVETPGTVENAPGQLRGCRGPVYIAGTNQAAVDKALQVTQGTTIGVMNSEGHILKKSTRKR